MPSSNVATTSINNFHDNVGNFASNQEQAILGAMMPGCDYSLSELAQLTGIEKSSVAARANHMKLNHVIYTARKRKCSITGVTINALAICQA